MDNLLRIAICEDSESDRTQLITILQASSFSTDITLFECGEEFLANYKKQEYDLIFMDIYMTGMTGVEVVTKVRQIDSFIPIAFTTTSIDHTLESYRLDVLKYLEKPVQPKAVYEFLQLALFKKQTIPTLSIKNKNLEQKIPLSEILYLEQTGRQISIHLAQGEPFCFTGKLMDIIEQLPTNQFYQCHKSYIVNFAYVITLNKELMIFEIQGGSNVHLRRDSYWKIKKAYETYLFQQAREGVYE